jgi:hypothetical protein
LNLFSQQNVGESKLTYICAKTTQQLRLVMCRRVAILWDIDKKTVKEITSYLKRSYRIYYILLVNALYNAGFNFYFHNLYTAIYDSVTVLLFILFIYIFRKLTTDPITRQEKEEITTKDIPTIHHAFAVVSLLATLYLFGIVYGLITSFNYLLFLNFFSVLIQISTIYILFKFLKKVEATEFLIQDEEAV